MRKTITFTCDEEVWNRAKHELPTTRSEFLETQLRIYLNQEIETDTKIIEEINEKRTELNMLEKKLEEINTKKARQMKNEHLYDSAMIVVNRIISIHGKISFNQLINIAKQQRVPYDGLKRHCRKNNINIVRRFEPPKEGEMTQWSF